MKTFKSKLREVSAIYKAGPDISNIKITKSSDVNELVRKIFPVDINYREAMVVLYLNNSNRTISYGIASIGSITGTLVDIRLVLRDALLSLATGIILVHNHPSGNLTPSNTDKQLTQKVKEAGKLMEIKLLDHLIITENDYYSFMDDGIFNF